MNQIKRAGKPAPFRKAKCISSTLMSINNHVLPVPKLYIIIVPDGWPYEIISAETNVRELCRPIILPLLIEMGHAALVRNGG